MPHGPPEDARYLQERLNSPALLPRRKINPRTVGKTGSAANFVITVSEIFLFSSGSLLVRASWLMAAGARNVTVWPRCGVPA